MENPIPRKNTNQLLEVKQKQLEESIEKAIIKQTKTIYEIIETSIKTSDTNNYKKLLLACAKDYYPPQTIESIKGVIKKILKIQFAEFKQSFSPNNKNFDRQISNRDQEIPNHFRKLFAKFLSEKFIQLKIDNYFSKKEYKRIYTTEQIKSILQYFKVIDDIDDIMDDSADNFINYDLIKDDSCQKYQTSKLETAITQNLHMYDQYKPDKNFFFLVKLPLHGFNLSNSNLTQTFDILEKNKRYDVVLKALPSIYHAINCPMLSVFINRLAKNKQGIFSTYTNYITNISEDYGTLYEISTALETTKKFLAGGIGTFMHKKIGLRTDKLMHEKIGPRKDKLSTFAKFLDSLLTQCQEKLKKSSRGNSPNSDDSGSSGYTTDDERFRSTQNHSGKVTSREWKRRRRSEQFKKFSSVVRDNNRRSSTSHNRRRRLPNGSNRNNRRTSFHEL